jgi:uncharacterized membrane protein
MGQDPNQPYSGPYGQPGGVPPQQNYQGGYPPQQQQQPGAYPPPPTGYQQPPTGYQYQQPYGAPGQYNTGHPNGATTINLDPNVAAGLSYLGAWLTGLIFFLLEKQNRFVRFHAMQSILIFASLTVLSIVFSIIGSVLAAVSIIGCLITPIISLLWLVVWLICMINAFQGKYFKLPVIGDYAERFANSGTGVTGL